MNKIKILVIESNKEPYTKVINNSMNEIYGLVYYPYKEIEIEKNVFLIYSKEATEKQDTTFKQNIKINDTLIYGTIVIISRKNNKFISLTTEQIKELKDFFSNCADIKFEI